MQYSPRTGKENTFGDYQFESWVPEHTRDIIRSFWGQFGRSYRGWLENAESYSRKLCHHGPNPNGFGNPPNGATAFYFLSVRGTDNLRVVRGRYLHRWNNMGSLIDDKGEDHTVSSCDYWVRVFTSEEEARSVIK